MKKQILLMSFMMMGFMSTTIYAQPTGKQHKMKVASQNRISQPISFIERGVEFLIFPDGSFEFTDTEYQISRLENRDRRSARINMRRSPGNSEVIYTNAALRTEVFYFRNGLISQINDIPLDYDSSNRIARVGSVNMSYQNGNGFLRTVGNLKVNYNHWGEIVHLKGEVNGYNKHVNDSYGYVDYDDFDNNTYDANYYYYKKNGKLKKHKKRN
ncbi:hypothetical protein SAMN03097699_1114 [Flavobacteriaceae bacterium MAR_2010_188]|nr:hypothetical protein SAMN03097699_1114 [Flavobacteriaceae bacterium MAR_2010_188]